MFFLAGYFVNYCKKQILAKCIYIILNTVKLYPFQFCFFFVSNYDNLCFIDIFIVKITILNSCMLFQKLFQLLEFLNKFKSVTNDIQICSIIFYQLINFFLRT